jgi:hypothetical protein
MKTRGAWVKIAKFVGMTGLACGLVLLPGFEDAAKRILRSGAGLVPLPASAVANLPRQKNDPKILAAYGKLPLRFEENQGQTNSEVRFVSHGSGYELFLTPQDAVLALRSPAPQAGSARRRLVALRESRTARLAETSSAVRIHLEGTNPAPRIMGVDPLPGKTNYFIGNDPKKWHTDVPSYARVKYADIYPGVDLDFYGNQRRLEYDFVVAPGASPNAIRLHLEGAQKMRLNAQGDLELSVPGGELVLQKPVVYQLVNGERHEIAGSYAVSRGNEIAFSVPAYDRSKPLILDPVLNYSTYLGGSVGASVLGTGVDQGFGIALDTAGNAYVAGATFSTDFPTPAAVKGFQKGPLASNAGGAAFVSEIDPTGTTLLYSSYIAGSTPGEIAQGIAVDSTGKIYLTGQTLSTDFPTSSTIAGLKSGLNPGAAGGTSFIVKLDPSQTGLAGLVYSSYLGGTSGDIGEGIAVDAKGNAYVTGLTLSPPGVGGAVTNLADFPVTAGAFQSVLNSPNGNAFLTRIDTTQAGTASLIYSTYLGGSDVNIATAPAGFGDTGFGVAVDGANNAYIVGTTISDDFPTTAANALRSTKPLAITNGNNTVFVSKINTAPNANPQLVYSTYLGGEVSDFGTAIALGPNNVAYVTGSTSSLAFPTFPATPFQTTGHASGVAFISLIDTGKIGSLSLQYSTYLGGTGTDAGNAIAADAQGNAYVAGKTSSNIDFPIIPGALQPVYPGAGSAGFISKLNPGNQGQADLLYSTYFGGSGGGGANQDQIHAIALDASNPPNVFVTGETFSAAKFPIFPAGAFQTSLKGTSDAFVAKLTLIPTVSVTPSPFDFGTQPVGVTSTPQTFTLVNNTNVAVTFTSIATTGVSPAANTDFAVATDACSPSVAAGAQCAVSVTFKPGAAGLRTGTLVFTDSDSSSPQIVNLSGTGSATSPGVGLAPTSLDFGGQMLTTTSAAKTVTLTNTGTSALTINSIAASGDFAATSTGAGACPISPATLPATAGSNTCTISVTFAPSVVGARTGTLTITDNAGGSPHSIPLAGSGWDFTLTGPATGTVTAAAPLKFNVTMTPLGGFNQGVGLTCTGAPANTTCTVVTPVTAADGKTAQTAQVTVTTTAMMIPPPSMRTPPASIRQVIPLLLALMLLLLLPKTKRLRLQLGMAAAMLMLVILAGCSGPSKPVPPPVNATLTITGTSNGTAGSVNHKVTVALTVN